MIKNILLIKYRLLVLIIEIVVGIIVLLLMYSFLVIPEGKKTFYIPASTYMSLYKTLENNDYSMHIIDRSFYLSNLVDYTLALILDLDYIYSHHHD